MLHFKRFLALLLAVLLALSLFACGAPASESVPPAETGSSTTPAPTFSATPAPTAAPTAKPTAEPAPVDEDAQLVEAAYALKEGEALSGTHTLTGTITSIHTAWSDKYENISVIIRVGELDDMPILCFRLEGRGAENLRTGDVITVTGKLLNYKGTVEFDAGCSLDAVDTSARPSAAPVSEDGYYYDPENVVLYLHYYGHLPYNFITKEQAQKLGWEGGSVERYQKGAAIGGNSFSNRERLLPTASGRTYTECDMYTKGESSRGACRLVFSSDGLYFYTDDHYESFTELYVTKDGEVKWK